jgi:hypothetical protein
MRIKVKVKPGKNESKVIKRDFADYEIWVKAPPIKGAANREVISVLANYFNVKAYRLRIVQGLTASMKIIELSE